MTISFSEVHFLFSTDDQRERLERSMNEFFVVGDALHTQESPEFLQRFWHLERDMNTIAILSEQYLADQPDEKSQETKNAIAWCRAFITRKVQFELAKQLASPDWTLVKKNSEEAIATAKRLIDEMKKIKEKESAKSTHFIRKGVLVYQGTRSGKNFEIVKSLWQNGVRPERFKGPATGQGEGMYVFSTWEKAGKHALSNYTRHVKTEGDYAIVITLRVNISPEEWDIDTEVCGNLIVDFLYDNADLVRKIPDGTITNSEGIPLRTSTVEAKEERLGPRIVNHNLVLWRITEPQKHETHGAHLNKPFSISEVDGNILGRIFTYLQRIYPHVTKRAEREWFTNKFSEIGALKYVGTRPLPVERIQFFTKVDLNWVSKDIQEIVPDLGKRYEG